MTTLAAVDLGATSGRVVLGRLGDRLELETVARFPNRPVRTPDGLHWSILELYRDVVEGLAAAAREAPELTSIGIDSWAVDYGLLREERLLGNPFSHRDERNEAGVEAVHALVDPAELYARNGLQFLPFNTVYQWTADRLAGVLDLADTALLLPDLLAHWLTGATGAERTNASTTGLLHVGTGEWDLELAARLAIPGGILPPLVDPGVDLGALQPSAARGIGATGARLTAVGSHDTASAVVAVPMTDPGEAVYISCGTWSLVGVELERPVLGEAGRIARFTNEGGVDRRIRYLHNVMGLWLLTETIRDWERDGSRIDLDELLAAAEAITEPVPVFDADDPSLLAPGDMSARIAGWLREHDLPVPGSRAAFARSILESLAQAYAATIRAAAELTGRELRVVHLVGGGSQNRLLCRLTADATGLPVLAGPAEATAIGNLLVQARAHGAISGDLEALRAVVARDFFIQRYEPGSPTW